MYVSNGATHYPWKFKNSMWTHSKLMCIDVPAGAAHRKDQEGQRVDTQDPLQGPAAALNNPPRALDLGLPSSSHMGPFTESTSLLRLSSSSKFGW